MSSFRNIPGNTVQFVLDEASRLALIPPTNGYLVEQLDDHTLWAWDQPTQLWVAAGGGGAGAVSSVFGRTGDVVANPGDYTTDLVTEAANLYFTNGRARAALSVTAPITYDSVTGIFAIPQAASGVDGFLDGADWTAFNAKVDRSGDSMSGFLTLVGDPVSGSQAATKNYVDSLANGLKWKQFAHAASTGNLVLSGEQTVDGHALVSGDRCLAKDQTLGEENGCWVVDAGAWTRATDSDTGTEMELAAYIVENGTVNDGLAFIQTVPAPITLGVTPLVFANFLSTTYTANGQALQLSGTQFSVVLDGTTLSQSASGLKIADAGIFNLQVNAAAAIARSKLAPGTVNTIAVNDASGNLVSHTAQTAGRVCYYDANGLPASSSASYSTAGNGDFTFAGLMNFGATSPTSGIIVIGGFRGLHAGGTESIWVGQSGSLTSGTRNAGIGQSVMTSVTTGSNNFGAGYAALNGLSSGTANVGIGQVALIGVQGGTANTAVGALAGQSHAASGAGASYLGYSAGRYQQNSNLTAIGRGALQGNSTPANNTGTQSTAVGYQSLLNNSSGTSNSALGYNSANQLTSGSQNSIFGALAGGALTTVNDAVLFGYAAGNQNSTGSSMVAVGSSSQRYITQGNQTSFGHQALRGDTTPANNTGSSNGAFGYQALLNTSSGSDNSAFGTFAGTSLTSGNHNNFFGSGAGQYQSTSSRNHAFGYRALRGNATPALNTGNDNIAIGYASLFSNQAGERNFAGGYNSLNLNISGSNNVALGHHSKENNTTGSGATALGAYSQRFWQTVGNQTSVGFEALKGDSTPANNTGAGNTAVGYKASNSISSSNQTTSLGDAALFTATTLATGSTAIGYASQYLSNGAYNTSVGQSSGRGLTTGNGNTHLGANAGYTDGTVTTPAGTINSIAIGYNSQNTDNNQMVIGSTTAAITESYIGNGVTNAAPVATRINATGGAGTNISGAALTLASGASTGTGTGGTINFQTSAIGASGSLQNTQLTRLTVMAGGTLQGGYMHNNLNDAQGNGGNNQIRSGTYTPVIGTSLNISSSIARPSMWTRVGNIVTVSGTVDINYTAGATNSSFTVSLPVTSGGMFVDSYQASGSINGWMPAIVGTPGIIRSIAATQLIEVLTYPLSSGGPMEHRFTFQYEVV